MERNGLESQKIKILIQGPPVILVGEKLTTLSRKQPRTLLYYLAAQSQPVSRQEICELFWPDISEEKARKNLREALSRIRTELGETDPFHAADDQIILDDSLVYSDKREFDRIVTPLLNHTIMDFNSSLPDSILLQLKRAMELCRTPSFLQGIQLEGSPGFENWKDQTNHRYTYIRLMIVERLVDHYISVGDLDSALFWLETGLETDRMNAEMNFLKLTCLRDLGKFQQMVETINLLESLYQQNDEPLPEEFVELRAKAEISRRIEDHKIPHTWPVQEDGEVNFFGRKTELEKLNWAMRRKGIILLKGEAGSGKTRLIKEFYTQQAYSPRLFYCRSNPLSVKVPFLTLLTGMEKEIREEEWSFLSRAEQEILKSFYHRYLQSSALADLPMGTDGWLPVFQDVFNLFVKLMEYAARKRPVLLVVDDAQWIDQASLSMIGYLESQHYFKRYGLLIVSKQNDENNTILRQTLLHLLRQQKLDVVNLQPFSERETSDFIQTMSGKNNSREYITNIYNYTGGNPFYLIEFMRESKRLMGVRGDPDQSVIPTPGGIKGLLMERMDMLNPVSQNVLQTAAVLGKSFSPDELEKIVDVNSDAVINALEELTRSGILKDDPNLPPVGGYTFSHEIDRELIQSWLSSARKRYLHQKAAHSILACRGQRPEISSRLAEHFEKASEPAEAVFYWLAAGRYARTAFSRSDTIKAYERAYKLIKENSYLFPVNLTYQVFSEWGDYAYDMSDVQSCETISKNCFDMGISQANGLLIGTGLSGLGRAAGMRGDTRAAEEFFQRALFHLQTHGHIAELSETYARIGIVRFNNDDYLGAKEALEEGLKFCGGDTNDPHTLEARIDNLSQLCILLVYMGWSEKALELAIEMANSCQIIKRRSASLQAHTILALAYYANGKLPKGINIALESEDAAENLQLRFWQSFLDIILGRSYLMAGDMDKAWQHTMRAIEREEYCPNSMLYDQARQGLGDIFRLVGEYDKAIKIYQSIIDTDRISLQTIESRLYLGVSLCNVGKQREGLSWINQSIELAAEKGITAVELYARLSSLLLFRTKKKLAAIEESANDLILQLQSRGSLFSNFYAKMALGFLAERRGDTRLALDTYAAIVGYCSKIGTPMLELAPLQEIIKLSQPGSLEQEEAKNRYTRLFKGLAKSATTPHVKGMVQKLRISTHKKWQYFVNG